jgi:hypothetical protein
MKGYVYFPGTPSNLIFSQQLVILFPNAPEVSFGIPTTCLFVCLFVNYLGAWMMVFAPLSLVLVFFTWLLLCALFARTISFKVCFIHSCCMMFSN